MQIEEAIAHAIDGDSILFVGAGFSQGATNVSGSEIPTGAKLAERYATAVGLTPGTSLRDASEEYAHAHGEDALIRDLKSQFQCKDILASHSAIAGIPWRRIYTTNYDDVAERSAKEAGRILTPVTASTEIYTIPKEPALCVHLNGFVDALDRETLWDEFKLVDSSYLTASIEGSPWMMMLRQDLRIARSAFFVGYSVEDLDIARLLSSTEVLLQKTFFVLGKSPTQATLRRARRFGTVCKLTTKEFAESIATTAAKHTTRDNGFHPLALREYLPQETMEKVRDADVLSLLLYGDVKIPLVQTSLASDSAYYLEREHIEAMLNMLEAGGRVVAITAGLGNGKSLLLHGLRHRAFESGFRVFDLHEKNHQTLEELEMLSQSSERVLLVVDDYPDWLDEIRFFAMRAGRRASLVVTARSAVHDIVVDDLDDATGDFELIEFPVDSLDAGDLDWVRGLLDAQGLWGKNAGLSQGEKMRFLKRRCNSEFHAVLLLILDSPVMRERLKALFDRLKARTATSKVLTGILALTVLGQLHGVDTLIDLYGTDAVLRSTLRRDPAVSDLLDLSAGRVKVRSAVVARYLIRETIPAAQLTGCLTQLARKADEYAQHNQKYWVLLKSLTRYGDLQQVLPESGKLAAVIEYYGAIKNLYSTRNNYHFWLQFAIACLVNGDLERSGKYFETSYALARKRERDTYQIDNHYARYLLTEAIIQPSNCDYMLNFRQARNTIHRQINNERRHYPYRVAIKYQDFIDRLDQQLELDDFETVRSSARFILQRIEQLPELRRRHRNVRECADAMEYVLGRIDERFPEGSPEADSNPQRTPKE